MYYSSNEKLVKKYLCQGDSSGAGHILFLHRDAVCLHQVVLLRYIHFPVSTVHLS